MAEHPPVQAVTLKMVAKAAGVSVSAVSHVLRGRAREMRISPSCEQRVHSAAQRLGYLGNYHARSLATQTTFSIGLAVGMNAYSLLNNPLFSNIVAGIECQVRIRGYDLHLIGGSRSSDMLRLAYDQLMAKRVDGLIIIPYLYTSLPDFLFQPGLPIVFIEGHHLERVSQVSQVNLDPKPGLYAAILHAKELGHRTITWFGIGPGTPFLIVQRRDHCRQFARREGLAFEEVLIEGVTPDLQEHTEHSLTTLHAAITRQYQPSKKSTFVFCQNDAVALVLMKVLADRGIQVPRDLSVLGFDDVWAKITLPSMSTVSHRWADLGSAAVDLVLDTVHAPPSTTPTLINLPSLFIARNSSGPARSTATTAGAGHARER
jgi:LacI family transcriptional regulator